MFKKASFLFMIHKFSCKNMKKDKIADLGRLSMGHAPAELAVCGEKPLQNSTASNMHACA